MNSKNVPNQKEPSLYSNHSHMKIAEKPTLEWKVKQLKIAEAFYNGQFVEETA